MADNTTLNTGTGGDVIGSDDIGGVKYQRVKIIHGADGTNDGDVASGSPLPVVQTGTHNIGTVTTVSAVTAITNALPAGTNAIGKLAANSGVDIGDVDVTSLPALPAGDNNIGNVDIVTMPNVTIGAAIPAGTNNIGDVDVLSLPALPTGTNNIGDVDIASIAAGDNNIGNVDIASIAAGDNNIGNVDIVTMPNVTLAAGTNNIGDVDVLTLPALPAGTNNIGDVDVLSVVPGTAATSLGKAEDGAHTTADVGVMALAVRTATPANKSDTDGDYEPLQVNAGALWTAPLGFAVSVQTDVTRPADTTAYAVNDALSDSTSAPTSGGFSLVNVVRKSTGSAIITDVIVTSSNDPATQLQGEIFFFSQSVTAINDNAAFAVSDAEIKTCVGKVPFTLEDVGNNGFFHAQNLSILMTSAGTNFRFLIRVKNAYTPASAEVITVKVKAIQVD